MLIFFVLLVSLIFIFSINIYISLFSFFMLVVVGGMKMSCVIMYNWLVYLIYIFLIGGLMISFTYMLNMCPNWQKMANSSNLLMTIMLFSVGIFNVFFFNSTKLTFMNASKNEFNQLELFYFYKWAFFMFMVLIFILFYVEKILNMMKGFCRL